MADENEEGRYLRETAALGETERALVAAAIQAAGGANAPTHDAWAAEVVEAAWALVARIYPRAEET